MMGPFLMAGLTHGDRRLVADPANISAVISEPQDDGHHVSLQVGQAGCVRKQASVEQLRAA